jgi:hypothetical protein
MIGGYLENQQIDTDAGWPETRAASEAIQRQCLACHQGKLILPRTLSDERDVSLAAKKHKRAFVLRLLAAINL